MGTVKPVHRMTIYTSGDPGEMNPTTRGYADADSISVSDEFRVREDEGTEFSVSNDNFTFRLDDRISEFGRVDRSVCDGQTVTRCVHREDSNLLVPAGLCTSTIPSEAGSGKRLGDRTPKIFWTGTVIPQSGFSRFLINLGFWFDGVIWEGANPRSDGEGGWL